MIGEVWQEIPGRPLYEASNLGRIRSWRIPGCRNRRRQTPKILSQSLTADSHGYPTVSLQDAKELSKNVRVHILVAAAFLGKRPVGTGVRHLDGDPRNNRLSNLVYGTPKENSEDMVRQGRSCRGVKQNAAKLSEEDVLTIVRLRREGRTGTSLAKEYHVNFTTIYSILDGRTWGFLTGLPMVPKGTRGHSQHRSPTE